MGTSSELYDKICLIRDQTIQELSTKVIPPYPGNYDYFFEKISSTYNDATLTEEIRRNRLQYESSPIDNVQEYVDLTKATITSFTQNHNNISAVAHQQSLHIRKLATQKTTSSSDYIEIVKSLSTLGRELVTELQKADNTIHELNKQLEEALAKSRLDPLTKALNKTALLEDLPLLLQEGKNKPLPLSLAIIDIDDFKHLNDTHGHLAGDRMLALLAKTMISTLKRNATLYRFGGEEFVILFNRLAPKEALETMQKLLKTVEATHLIYHAKTLKTTMSVGVGGHKQGDSVESFLARIDTALYNAKNGGKNCAILAD